MTERLSELRKIFQKVSDPQTSLQSIKEIYEKDGVLATISIRLIREDKEEGELQGQIYLLSVQKIVNYLSKNYGDKKLDELVAEKVRQFPDQELELFEWIINGFFLKTLRSIASIWESLTDEEKKAFDSAFALGYYQGSDGETPDQDKMEKKLKKMKEALEKIGDEKTRRRQAQGREEDQLNSNFSLGDGSNSSTENNKGIGFQFSREIKNLQSQLNSLKVQQQNRSETTTTNNSQEQKKIEQALKDLQNNLQNIEKKQNQSSTTSQQEKQELAKLKSELSKLQNQLKQSQDKQSQTQDNQQKKDGFNWLYVVIPLGVLTMVLGIVIAYLLGKKNKKE